MSASVAENKLNCSGWLQIIEIKSQVLKLDLKNQQKHEFEFSRVWDLFIGAIDDQDHRIRTSNEAFFQQNPQLLGIWGAFGGHLGYFRSIYQHPFWYCESLVCFPFISHYFYKKLSLYKFKTPSIYLELELEFGPQRIRDLAIVCP